MGKFRVGQKVTDISGAEGKVVAVDPARKRVAVKVTDEGTNSHMRKGKTYDIPESQVK